MPLDPARQGEFGFIRALARRAGRAGRRWPLGIGDDAAILAPRSGYELAVTLDALHEDVHFRLATTDARSLGHKALVVNLSDLAAMGARPLGFVLGLGLPPELEPRVLEGFAGGLLAAARASSCPLVGGDTTRAARLAIAITAIGEVPRGCALRRSGARPGDHLFVTGTLGAAALGLRELECAAPLSGLSARAVARQRRPRARLREGTRLRESGLASAAIDVSDGLVQDLGHLLERSGVGAELWLERLPTERGFARVCATRGLDPTLLAASGGEDYELLFCASRAPSAAALAKKLGCRVTEIGRITRARRLVTLREGEPVELSASGFDHFKTVAARSEK
jgi:thiamine-monophosphate kinase